MLQLLAVACLLALSVAEPEPEASAEPVFVHRDEHDYLNNRRAHDDRREDRNHYGHREGHVSDDILRKEHKIIEEVFSPDYYEPTLILDYRYLKSGGRDYTRGPGGQILILPHGVHTHEPKEHKDYDSLIEFLRLRNLAQASKKRQHGDDRHSYEPHEDHHEDDHERLYKGRW